ncbi:MAG: hypothetical protein RIE73_02575 [Coleofasciculus sp. C1-SOL-03]|uniref:NACHT domain-containing protein n=1 Tax=Coleofasciculus sp. C1-SOL-03 TaxID=3069522 RepID=UPI003304035E
MSERDYDWKRFWCPRSGYIDLSDRGYLVDPESEWGQHYNPNLVTLEAIADIPCLVLLGEPGIGKSQEMKNLRKYTEGTTNQTYKVLALNLQAYGSEERLVRNLFESRRFTDWINGTHRLYVFLDSLDEGLLRIETLATLLVEELGNEEYRDQLSRLYLRIACRTAVFPNVLEEGLDKLWTKDNLSIYELTPLRRIDVERSVERCGLEPAAFMDEVDRKGAAPFAIKPITLDFLVNIFQRNNGQFPANQRLADLYLQGCSVLCEEPREKNYHPQRKPNNLEVEQRLIIAARIAAVTVFARRFAVWIGQNRGNVPDEDVLLGKLCLGSETANGRVCPVTENAIREVLDTGLFSSRGTNRMGWAHQTYAEFLAAWYLLQHNVSLAQVLALIIHPDQRVVPQLQETAAWLASMMPDLFQEIMKTDPDVLLKSDIATTDESNKAKLVESLLRLHDEEKLSFFQYLRYDNLNHSKLPDQLRAYICDSTKSQWSRLTAITIALHCNEKAVQDCLADVALDPTQSHEIRKHAACTVCYVGDESTKARFKPLALGEAGDDPNDELKGYGLRAVWSNHMTVEDVLNCFSQPKSRGVIPTIGGVYQKFIAWEFAQRLQLADLPVVLQWIGKQVSRRELHYPFNKLVHTVIFTAWEHLENPEIMRAFAQVVFIGMNRHLIFGNPRSNTLFKKELTGNQHKRRQLIEAIISILPDSAKEPGWLLGDSEYSPLVILEEDFLWLIECLRKSKSDRLQKVYAYLIYQKLDWNSSGQLSTIINISQYNSILKSKFTSYLEPIELDSAKAKQAKASYLELQNLLKPPEPEPLLDPPPKQRVLAAIDKVEADQPQLWWQICVEMTLMPRSTNDNHYDILTPDITRLPGWEEAEADTKARIVKTAKRYLDAGDPETQTWMRTNNLSHPEFAGYQALHLIAKQEPEFISTISSDLWTKWIPLILKSISLFDGNGARENEFCRQIVKTAYQSAQNEFIEALLCLMIQNAYQPHAFDRNDVYRLTSDLLDQCLASLILSRVHDEDLNAGMLEILLTDIFNYDVDQATALALPFISKLIPESGEARAKAIVAARLLANYPNNSSWSVLWSTIQQDHEFGREVLEAIAFQATCKGKIEQELKEEYLADLYIFLSQQYPEVEEPEPETNELIGIQAQILESIGSVRLWKNYILQRLQERGTPEACDALRKIIRELPDQKDKLQQRLLETEILARRKTWKPPQPEALLQLVSDKNKRLVQNGQQLLNVLIESLKRLELELQGETPAVRDLWDKVGDKTFKPIDENAFSDYVKRFLDKDLKSRGIIVNREVELRRGYGNEPGERTDIHVDAVLKRPNGETYDSITVIIEVKGCWHSEVKTAMATQLVERYLKDNVCSYGLYLIGWFSCPQWDDQDSRNKKTQKIGIDKARNKFDKQAEEISLSGNVVRAYVLNTSLR